MRPVAHRAQPAGAAYADRHRSPFTEDLGALSIDEVRRAAHERRTARIPPHGDDGGIADHSASAHPRHGSTLGQER